jgi:hypothetical protein
MLHDYYAPHLPLVKKAVEDYEQFIGHKIVKLPAGDDFSIYLVKI